MLNDEEKEKLNIGRVLSLDYSIFLWCRDTSRLVEGWEDGREQSDESVDRCQAKGWDSASMERKPKAY